MVFKKKNPVKKKKYTKNTNTDQPEIIRVRLPKQNEVIGLLEQRLGGSRSKVRCMDGKTRICRIPGRMKRHLWIRENDIVLVEPWELSGDERGDIVYKYRKNETEMLKKKGYLKTLEDMDEF